jgi:ribosome assembly protein YihI (activator of Der GTPase)
MRRAAFPENNDENTILDMLLERVDLGESISMGDLEEIIPQNEAFQE